MTKGFTLFELLIIIAVIGILASIAIPAYCDYLPRSVLSERLIQVKQGINRKITDYAKQNKHLPQVNNDVLKLTDNDKKHIEAIAWYPEQSALLVTFLSKSIGNDRHLVFTATGATDNLQWRCTNQHTLLDDKHKPIPNKYLPQNCRSNPQ